MIQDDQWKKIKEDTREASKNRELMMLRGTGAGGVKWMQNSATQKDMEFLLGREANKSEVYSLYPGLESMTDKSATEANANAGKRTFMENVIWPRLVRISEKIVNKANEIFRAEKSRRTAANMQLLDVESSWKNVEIHLPLLEKRIDVWSLERVVFGSMSIAAAEITIVLAVRNMNVHADAGSLVAVVEPLDHGLFPLLLGNAVGAPGRNGGIACITGTGIAVLNREICCHCILPLHVLF
jgi:hypothetical protein